ncbi:MAG: PD-(D/E)XK nuclease family protein [Christensenellaceae bacterium]|jgi:ATP-dependent helicase/DNAse subunit B|nr:PD-(D/E)XK nuclease family protein [Christensenellaceae bacterium]
MKIYKGGVGSNLGRRNDCPPGGGIMKTVLEVASAVEKNDNLDPIFVLVPDRFTLQMEKMIMQECKKRGVSTLLNLRVVTFSMLYQLLVDELSFGMPAVEPIDKTTAVLLLWKAIRNTDRKKLQWFSKNTQHYDFAEQLFNTINQIKSSMIDINTIAGQENITPVAKKKFNDIAVINREYQGLLQNKVDSFGSLQYLINNIHKSKVFKGSSIFVCGFTDLTPARAAAIAELEKITTVVNNNSIVPNTTSCVCYVHNNNDIADEAFNAVKKTMELLNGGFELNDIVCLLCNFDDTASIYKAEFEKNNIPVNIDVGGKLKSEPMAKYLRDLLEMKLNDGPENTLAVVYNKYSGIPADRVFQLETEIIKYNRRAGFYDEIPKIKDESDLQKIVEDIFNGKLQSEPPDNYEKIVQSKLIKILETIQNNAADLTGREYINLFWTLCSAAKVSNVPVFNNRILVAAADEWIPFQTKCIIIANANGDNFPQGQSDTDILQESDLKNTHIEPTAAEQRRRNRKRVDYLLSCCENVLILCGDIKNKSDLVRNAVRNGAVEFSFRSPKNNPLVQLPQNISFGKEVFLKSLKKENEIEISPTLLESFYACPYKNFLERGLRITERQLYQLKPNVIGNLIHDALFFFFDAQIKKTGIPIEDAIQKSFEKNNEYEDYFNDKQNVVIINELKKEIRFIITKINENLLNGNVRPYEVEKKIRFPLSNDLFLSGRIDRIDKYSAGGKDYFVIVDYKTGSTVDNIVPAVRTGEKLQLPLYASFFDNQSENNIVVAAGYLPLSAGFKRESKDFKFKGFILKEECEKLDRNLVPNGRDKRFMTAEQIAELFRTANEKVKEAVSKMGQGEIFPNAINSKFCEYCGVRAICLRRKR